MQAVSYAGTLSAGTSWTGRIMSALPVLFMLIDGVMKVAAPAPVVESSGELGYPASLLLGIGILQLACIAVYLYPRTSILGAVLLTGYLGGAVASHVRVEAGAFPILFPVILGILLWVGLYLRDDRLRLIVAPRS